ncbi:CD3072 family TudS-related putative desulfidase [Faecalimonas sp.]
MYTITNTSYKNIMKQKIVFVSHCFFNDAAKLKNPNLFELEKERTNKRKFLKKILDQGIEIVQLPCPELILYGVNRWGHAASQFNTAFFRKASRKMLEPYILQIEEYSSCPERFEILGIVGIDGSPSCGVKFTYDGEWGGEFTGNENVLSVLSGLQKVEKSGIFIKVMKDMLMEKGYEIPFYSLEDFEKISSRKKL